MPSFDHCSWPQHSSVLYTQAGFHLASVHNIPDAYSAALILDVDWLPMLVGCAIYLSSSRAYMYTVQRKESNAMLNMHKPPSCSQHFLLL